MAAKARLKIKTETLKLNVSPDDLQLIDEAKEISGHATRTDYMVDSALSGSPVYLHHIAVAIGKLGQISLQCVRPLLDVISWSREVLREVKQLTVNCVI